MEIEKDYNVKFRAIRVVNKTHTCKYVGTKI